MVTKAGISTFLYGRRVGGSPAPPLLKWRSSKAFIVGTIVIAVFTDTFLYSLVVPVLPFAFTVRAGVAEDDLQKWTSIFLSVYGAALAVGSPVAGWVADRTTSRRAPLLLGLFALGGSTAMLCVGMSLPVLITGRILQGISASVVWTVGLALLSDTVAKEDMGQAMGYVALSFSVGALAGPLLGGAVYAAAGYYAVFAMGFGLIGLDIILRFLMIERCVAEQWSVPDTVGELSVGAQAVSDNRQQEIQQSPTVDQSLPSITEKDSSPPAAVSRLPVMLTLLKSPRLIAALFGCFVQSVELAAFDSALPLYVKNTFSWTSTGAGLVFLCLVVPTLLAPLWGYISDRYGSRTVTTVGLIGSVPFWVCLRFVTYNTIGQKVLLCALLSGIGFCLAMSLAPLMADIDHTVALEEKRRPEAFGKRGAAAQGFGLFNGAFALGVLIGPLWAGFLVQDAGWGTMGWTLGLLSGVGAVVTFWWTGGRIVLKGNERSSGEAV